MSSVYEYSYDIRQFNWDKETNSFYAEAYNLQCAWPDCETK